MLSSPHLRFVIAGQLRRDYIILQDGRAILDKPGGNLLYAAGGLGIWEKPVGLIGKVGKDYPQEWLQQIADRDFDIRGISIFPQPLDLRYFVAYLDENTKQTDNPIAHFKRVGLEFPHSLLGYVPSTEHHAVRIQPTPASIQLSEIPESYLDAIAVHICPLDYYSLTLLLTVFRQTHIHHITLDLAVEYMNYALLDELPKLLDGIAALVVSEEKMRNLFKGRSTDLWEMAEDLASHRCEMIVIDRKKQGQYIYDCRGNVRWSLPMYPVKIIDPTGLGDAFCGGFLAGYCGSYDPLEAALRGGISASFAVEGSGPFYGMDALPSLAQARLDVLRQMARRV
ncbi:MAG: carbohydrate kinase family protein [Anaerolineae bacterium]|nr:carbohydrate kinase family protein [Anaerolineae bacterium]